MVGNAWWKRSAWPAALAGTAAALVQLAASCGPAAAEEAGAFSSRDRRCSSIALVLSLDSSGSVTAEEFSLEKHGFADALRDPAVQDALFSGGPINIAALVWADPAMATWNTGWRLLATPADAARMAERIEAAPRIVGGDTGLGNGLEAALALLSRPEACARRRIVNITGDGRETTAPFRKSVGTSLAAARHKAAAAGVTVNGLAITAEDPGLFQYYRSSVITGTGSFAMEVSDVADFAAAIRRKIARETEAQVAAVPGNP